MPSTGSKYAKPTKKCFIAPNGKVILAIDLNSLEDVVLANLSGDKNKLAVFEQGLNGHCMNSYYYFREEIEAELPRLDNEDTNAYIKRYYTEASKGNKVLKSIRQKSKAPTFGLAYGCHPPKVAKAIGGTLEEGEAIFNRYHNELYSGVTEFKKKVTDKAKSNSKIHLGLGCYLNTDNINKHERTLGNAVIQFWSIITLLTVNKMNSLIKANKLTGDIEIISTIYDSIYFCITEDSKLVKWVNDNVVPIMTKDFITDQRVANSAESDLGYDWANMITISNESTVEEIEEVLTKLKEQ